MKKTKKITELITMLSCQKKAAQMYNSFIYLCTFIFIIIVLYLSITGKQMSLPIYHISLSFVFYLSIFLLRCTFYAFIFEKHLKKVTLLLNVQTLVMSDDCFYSFPVCSPNCISLQEEKWDWCQ